MDKNLTVYPISTGNELNIFSGENVSAVRIMDMSGSIVCGPLQLDGVHHKIDIKHLPHATYIVEVVFADKRTGRSVFVKT